MTPDEKSPKFSLFYSCLWLLFFLSVPVQVDLFFGVGGMAVSFLLIIVSGLSLIGILWCWFGSSRHRLRAFCSVLVLSIVSLVLSILIGRAQVEISKTRGDQVAKAIQAYRSERGMFPVDVGDLVPDYMRSVPSAAMSLVREVPLRIRHSQEGAKTIEFDSYSFKICSRSLEVEQWVCRD